MSDREAFLKAIAAAPWDAELPRLVYADWLDEHDEPEEADRQRKWIESSRWIREFVAGLSPSYEEVMEAADTWVQSGAAEYTYDNTESYKNLDYDQWPEFWRHYEIVTGNKTNFKEDYDDGCPFTCSC